MDQRRPDRPAPLESPGQGDRERERLVLIEIPPRSALVRTHDDDPLHWYYRPVVGRLYLRRLELALGLIDSSAPIGRDRVLEIGFGSGFFLPSLSRRFKSVHGVDLHPQGGTVQRRLLQRMQVQTYLTGGSAYHLPYQDGSFDCVVAVSLLEQLDDLDVAISEMARVARDGAPIIVGFPTRNLLMHVLFRLMLLGRNDADFHVSSHHDILAALRRHVAIDEMQLMPKGAPMGLAMYVACRCHRKQA